MRPLLATLALLVATPALAAPPKDAGSANVPGVVEVPLYAGADASDERLYVEAKAGDATLLLRLATGHGEVRLSSAGLGKTGARASGKEGEQTATVGALALGSATFSKVKVHVNEKLDVDGELGLGAFPSLAWAVMPSKGVLRIAPGEQGPALVAGIAGKAVPYTDESEAKRSLGSGPKVEFARVPFLVTARVSDTEFGTSLALERPKTRVLREADATQWFTVKGVTTTQAPLPNAPGFDRAEDRVEWRPVTVSGASVSVGVSRPGAGLRSAYLPPVVIGADALGRMDLAIDPSTHTLVAVRTDAVSVKDRSPAVEAELRRALEPKAPADGAEAPDPKAANAARAGALGALAQFLASQGRWEDALAARTEATQLDAGTCTSWLSHGETLLSVGRPAEAVTSLRRAHELYAPWGALPLAERQDAQDAKAKAEKGGKPYEGPAPQDHGCHVAPGRLALAHAALGDRAAVDALYPSALDLDPGLALAAGSAALRAGDNAAAEAAYRQAIHLTRSSDAPLARAGLFLALAGRDPALARVQIEKTRFAGADGLTDPLTVERWYQGMPEVDARGALAALVKADPENAALRLVQARAAVFAGDADGRAAASEAVLLLARQALARHADDARAHALTALALLVRDDVAGARAAADAAVSADGSVGLAWFALAEAQRAAGDTAGADVSIARASLADAENPIWLSLTAR